MKECFSRFHKSPQLSREVNHLLQYLRKKSEIGEVDSDEESRHFSSIKIPAKTFFLAVYLVAMYTPNLWSRLSKHLSNEQAHEGMFLRRVPNKMNHEQNTSAEENLGSSGGKIIRFYPKFSQTWRKYEFMCPNPPKIDRIWICTQYAQFMYTCFEFINQIISI